MTVEKVILYFYTNLNNGKIKFETLEKVIRNVYMFSFIDAPGVGHFFCSMIIIFQSHWEKMSGILSDSSPRRMGLQFFKSDTAWEKWYWFSSISVLLLYVFCLGSYRCRSCHNLYKTLEKTILYTLAYLEKYYF